MMVSYKTASNNRVLRHASSGQALIEIVVASAALMLVLFGIVLSVQFALSSVIISKNKTQSVYLAREGLELVRARRDAQGWNFSSHAYPTVAPPFTRVISVSKRDDTATVTSTVTWKAGSTQYLTELQTALTNWR